MSEQSSRAAPGTTAPAGYHAAWEQQHTMVSGYLVKQAGAADAADLLVEVYLRGRSYWPKKPVGESPAHFLKRQARFVALSHFRQSRRWREYVELYVAEHLGGGLQWADEGEEAGAVLADDPLVGVASRRTSLERLAWLGQVVDALEQLPKPLAVVALLRWRERLEVAEIARHLGLGEAEVRKRLEDAHRLICQKLGLVVLPPAVQVLDAAGRPVPPAPRGDRVYRADGAVVVRAWSDTPDYELHYTTDQTMPEWGDAPFPLDGLRVDRTCRLRIRAWRAEWLPSDDTTLDLELLLPAPTLTPPPGRYAAPVTVTASYPRPAAICYTLTGSTPGPESPRLPASGVRLQGDEVVRCVAITDDGQRSAIAEGIYRVGAAGRGLAPAGDR